MVVLSGPEVEEGALFGALVLYRVVYFLAPLFVATLILAGVELYRQRARVGKVVGAATALSAAVVPHAMAFAVFVVGALLLFTGAMPPTETRLSRLGGILPLGVIEASHFLASVAGGLLLVLARGLQRRLDGAYQATLVLLGGGIVLTLLRGLDWVSAAIPDRLPRDVGPSAGYLGCLGLVCARLPEPLPPRAGLSVSTALVAALLLPPLSSTGREAKRMADLAHLLAFPLGFALGRIR